MSEKEELARLAKRMKQIEAKYAKLAKKRLNYLNKQLMSDQDFLDLSDADFKQIVDHDLNISSVRLSKLNDVIYSDGGQDLATMSDQEFEQSLTWIGDALNYYRQVMSSNQNRGQQN